MKVLVTGGPVLLVRILQSILKGKKNDVAVCDNLTRAPMLNKSSGDPLFNWNYLKNLGKVMMIKATYEMLISCNEQERG